MKKVGLFSWRCIVDKVPDRRCRCQMCGDPLMKGSTAYKYARVTIDRGDVKSIEYAFVHVSCGDKNSQSLQEDWKSLSVLKEKQIRYFWNGIEELLSARGEKAVLV